VTANGTTASPKKSKFLVDNFNGFDIIKIAERFKRSEKLNSQVIPFLTVLLDKTNKV